MWHWLIPYLVGYNASHVSDWKYGPEHVFKVDIRFDFKTIKDPQSYTNFDMFMPCRTLNLSFIECQIESLRSESFEIDAEGYRIYSRNFQDLWGLEGSVFQVEFNEKEMKMTPFIDTAEHRVSNMHRAIIGLLNLDFDLHDKDYYKNYTSMENSTIGTCRTNFILNRWLESPIEEKSVSMKWLKGYRFVVPAFENKIFETDETFVVEKYRNLNECSKLTPYLFGTMSLWNVEPNRKFKYETKIKSSRSLMNFGKRSFNAYTSNIGNYAVTLLANNTVKWGVKFHELIRLSLDSIRPATDVRYSKNNF